MRSVAASVSHRGRCISMPWKAKKIRALTDLSQPKFATILNVDVGTLRNWEQGRREPTGPAKALLRAIRNNPKAVLEALVAA